MVKTRLQASASKYSSPIDCFRKIIANEGGPRALYRGLSANLIGVAPEKSIKLVRNNIAKHTFIKYNYHVSIKAANEYFREQFERDDGSIALHHEIIAGAGAGTCQVRPTITRKEVT